MQELKNKLKSNLLDYSNKPITNENLNNINKLSESLHGVAKAEKACCEAEMAKKEMENGKDTDHMDFEKEFGDVEKYHRMYENTSDPSMKKTYLNMANDEAKHAYSAATMEKDAVKKEAMMKRYNDIKSKIDKAMEMHNMVAPVSKVSV